MASASGRPSVASSPPRVGTAFAGAVASLAVPSPGVRVPAVSLFERRHIVPSRRWLWFLFVSLGLARVLLALAVGFCPPSVGGRLLAVSVDPLWSGLGARCGLGGACFFSNSRRLAYNRRPGAFDPARFDLLPGFPAVVSLALASSALRPSRDFRMSWPRCASFWRSFPGIGWNRMDCLCFGHLVEGRCHSCSRLPRIRLESLCAAQVRGGRASS